MLNFENLNVNNPKLLFKKIFIFWIKKYEIIFFTCLLIVFIFIVGKTIKSIYFDSWSEQKKQEYLNKKYQQIDFQEKKFNSILKELEAKQKEGL